MNYHRTHGKKTCWRIIRDARMQIAPGSLSIFSVFLKKKGGERG